MELANIEADEFCSKEEQVVFRAKLFDMISNVNEKASAKKRKLLGQAGSASLRAWRIASLPIRSAMIRR